MTDTEQLTIVKQLLASLLLDCIEVTPGLCRCRHCAAVSPLSDAMTHTPGCVVGQILEMRNGKLEPRPPLVLTCNRCGRQSVGETLGAIDTMTQPSGQPCNGRFFM